MDAFVLTAPVLRAVLEEVTYADGSGHAPNRSRCSFSNTRPQLRLERPGNRAIGHKVPISIFAEPRYPASCRFDKSIQPHRVEGLDTAELLAESGQALNSSSGLSNTFRAGTLPGMPSSSQRSVACSYCSVVRAVLREKFLMFLNSLQA